MSIVIAPPFIDPELANRKVQIAEDLWNTRDPERVGSLYRGYAMAQPNAVCDWTCSRRRVFEAEMGT
jgi:nuclear transport factor 2 (NTF2) superfamily protein